MLRQTNIKRDLLQTTLEQNLQDHIEIFNLANEKWKQDYVDYVKSFAKKVSGGDLKARFSPPVKPQSYAKNYENVINQLKFSADDIITLTDTEFQNYIADEWNFSSNFYSVSSTYVQSGSLSASNQTKMLNYISRD